MKLYIQELANRLSQFSEKLDNSTLLINKPWVHIDNLSNYHKYIFKRNGELVMSLNGQAKIGKWEYISSAKSILIDRIDDKILLNLFYFDPAVLILKIDGINKNLFILANETLIPDLDVKKYLQSIIIKKIYSCNLKNGSTLEIYLEKNRSPQIGMKVTIDGAAPENGKFYTTTGLYYDIQNGKIQRISKPMIIKLTNGKTLEIDNGQLKDASAGMVATVGGENVSNGKYQSIINGHNYEIRDGRIFRITNPKQIKCKTGELLTVEMKFKNSISKGDLAFINNTPAKSGKYKFGLFQSIEIENGVITKLRTF